MSNDLQVTSNEILESLRLTTMGINSLSQQMGLVVSGQQRLERRMDGLEDRMTYYENNLRVNRSQQKQIKSAVMTRVNELLKIRFEGGHVADECIDTDRKYRGGFVSRCYTDAKRAGVMAESFWETPRVDYDRCIEYIFAWVPQVAGGVTGYKSYLDKRRASREREKRARR